MLKTKIITIRIIVADKIFMPIFFNTQIKFKNDLTRQ